MPDFGQYIPHVIGAGQLVVMLGLFRRLGQIIATLTYHDARLRLLEVEKRP